MSPFVPSLNRSLRLLSAAVLTALAIPVVLATGAAIPPSGAAAGILIGVFVGALARTGMWLLGEPAGERANALAIAAGLTAGVASVGLGVLAVLAGPAVLPVVPMVTAAGVAVWWIGHADGRRSA